MINRLKTALFSKDLDEISRASAALFEADLSALSEADLAELAAILPQIKTHIKELKSADLKQLRALEKAAAYAEQ